MDLMGHKDVKKDGTPVLRRNVGMFSLQKQRPQGDLTATFQYLKGPTRKLERAYLQGCVRTGQGVMASR